MNYKHILEHHDIGDTRAISDKKHSIATSTHFGMTLLISHSSVLTCKEQKYFKKGHMYLNEFI